MQFDHFLLRKVQTDDAESFFQLIDRNRPRLEDFFSGTVARTRTLEDTQNYFEEIAQRMEARTYMPFLLVDVQQQHPVGFLDLKNIDWNIPKGELGCFIDSALEGKKIAGEAMRRLIQYLHEEWQFRKLFLRTHPSNLSARGLAEKCGFEQEGLLRSDYKTTQGEFVDLVYYGLVHITT